MYKYVQNNVQIYHSIHTVLVSCTYNTIYKCRCTVVYCINAISTLCETMLCFCNIGSDCVSHYKRMKEALPSLDAVYTAIQQLL